MYIFQLRPSNLVYTWRFNLYFVRLITLLNNALCSDDRGHEDDMNPKPATEFFGTFSEENRRGSTIILQHVSLQLFKCPVSLLIYLHELNKNIKVCLNNKKTLPISCGRCGCFLSHSCRYAISFFTCVSSSPSFVIRDNSSCFFIYLKYLHLIIWVIVI